MRSLELDRRPQDERPVRAFLDPDFSWREFGTFDKERGRLVTSHAADCSCPTIYVARCLQKGIRAVWLSRTATASMRQA